MYPSHGIKNLKTQNSAKAPVRFENAGLKMHHSADTVLVQIGTDGKNLFNHSTKVVLYTAHFLSSFVNEQESGNF
jgi:hypothetical protein